MNSSDRGSDPWFVIDLVEKVFEGPYQLDDLKRKLAESKIFWSDLAMCPKKNFAWVRLFEIKELVDLCPPLPSAETLKHYTNIAFKQSSFIKLPLTSPEPAQKVKVNTPTASNKTETSAPITLEGVAPGRFSAQSRRAAPVAAPPKAAESAEWHLLIDDNECGPFSLREIETAFKQGKRPERAYVWRSPMKRWKPIGQVQELRHLSPGSDPAEISEDADDDSVSIENYRNLRRSFRKSFIASVMRISESGIKQMIGVSGNITPEGIHLHQDSFRVDYPLGSRHHLEIKPIKLTRLPAFRVTAVVRWVDPESYGIGFQFVDINENDQKLLQRYLEKSDKKT